MNRGARKSGKHFFLSTDESGGLYPVDFWSKRKKQKAGLNKAILDVGFGTLNKMLTYKISLKGGIVLQLPTRQLKPSQRCRECGKVHKDWAELSNIATSAHVFTDLSDEESRKPSMYRVFQSLTPNT